ncbi:MAG: DUF1559 domain-containing protein, partial [Planctomycetes bacterium]|nr:DUF1559 domain-containing protein [Planctomycetota bacterium]
GTGWDNQAVVEQRISVLECPSDPQAGERSNAGGTWYPRRNQPRSSYLLAAGNGTDYSRNYGRYSSAYYQGMFGNNGSARIRDITDGTSSTAAVGESWGGRHKCSSHYGPWGLSGVHTSVHGRVEGDTRNPNHPCWTTPGSCGWPAGTAWNRWAINAQWPQGWCRNAANRENISKAYAWQFNSGHAGGAQFLFADGSVHFLNESIDYFTFVLLNYIHDGRVANL